MVSYTTYTEELDQAVKKVCSPLYQQTFEIVTKGQFDLLSAEQQNLLLVSPNLITWYSGEQRLAIVEQLRHAHLKWFAQWLTEYSVDRPLYTKNSTLMEKIILCFTNLLFRIDLGDVIMSDETREEFQQIANTVRQCLLAIKDSNPTVMDRPTILFVQDLLQILFYLTLDDNMVIHLKSLQLVELLNTLLQTSNNDDEIHLHAYRILAVVMSEADMKKLQNASRIAAVFITFIHDTIDGGVRTEGRLHNNLRSLTVLTQHDEIREELIKQKGYELFLRCVLEEKFNLLKAKLPSLRILLTLSFNESFAASLKENTAFMGHVQALSSSAQDELQRIATVLVWQLKKKPEKEVSNIGNAPRSPATSKKQYDIMISYSHNDKELCHRISKRLVEDELRIWIDFQEIHGNIADTIADAIENSEIVLICMSDTYKQSPVCKSEATYANKRGCHIIPLVMTPHYKADGWLGFLTSALIYVDFNKVAFDVAYKQLKSQIQRARTNPGHETTPKQNSIHGDHSTLMHTAPKTLPTATDSSESPTVMDLPHCIDLWTEDHVKAFLSQKRLHVLHGAFESMNGRLLHRAYTMCLSNQQAMFASLKEDVAQSQYKATLSLKDYLIFLEEIKAYIPYTADAQLNPASAVCNLM